MTNLTNTDALLAQMEKYREKRIEEANMTGDRAICVTWDDAVTLIKNAPVVDAVPVTRCKDCIHRDWDVIDIPYGLTKRIEWCSIRFNADGENVMVSPNGFCSEAESKVSSKEERK